jgi:hypothetical protein
MEIQDRVRAIADQFREELQRNPSLGELLELLTMGLRSQRAELKALRPVPAATTRRSSVKELNDAAFDEATSLMADLLASLEANGMEVPLGEVVGPVLTALRGCSDILPEAAKLTAIRVETRKLKNRRIRVGDLVAIPAEAGRRFLAIVVAKNHFGVAYGFFNSAVLKTHHLVDPHPIYSGEEFVRRGLWKIFGHDEDLLALFPKEPEIFHYPSRSEPALGEFGAGETPSGTLRQLGRKEAQELGLETEQYVASFMPDMLETYLRHQTRIASQK